MGKSKSSEKKPATADSGEILEQIQKLPPGQKQRAIRDVVSYEGPLPPSKELKGYEDVLPGAADRILAMAEKDASHLHKMDVSRLDKGHTFNIVGLIIAFLLNIALIGAAIYFGMQKEYILSLAAFGYPVGQLLLKVFIDK